MKVCVTAILILNEFIMTSALTVNINELTMT